MKTTAIYFLLIPLILFASCGGLDGDDTLSGNSNIDQALEPAQLDDLDPAQLEDPITIDRKLIKTANVGFEVDEIKSTEKRIREAVKTHKGYITSEDQFNSYGRLNFSFVIKVPSVNFDFMMADIATGVEEFETRNVSVQDVTEEFIDIEARLKTKKELEQRYIGLLSQAKSINEILEIEDQVTYLREDIESFEGRLKYLKSAVSYSSITVTFYEVVPEKSKFGEKFGDNFNSGWKNFVYFFIMLTQLWPFIILIGSIILIIRIRRKKKLNLK